MEKTVLISNQKRYMLALKSECAPFSVMGEARYSKLSFTLERISQDAPKYQTSRSSPRLQAPEFLLDLSPPSGI